MEHSYQLGIIIQDVVFNQGVSCPAINREISRSCSVIGLSRISFAGTKVHVGKNDGMILTPEYLMVLSRYYKASYKPLFIVWIQPSICYTDR